MDDNGRAMTGSTDGLHTSLMQSLLMTPAVTTAELYHHPSELDLHASEQAFIRSAVGKRQREFAAARRCARQAMGALGQPGVPILPDRHGAPRWPPGMIGSMTHCAGFAAAAVAWSANHRAIGIDAEPHEALPEGVLAMIALPPELRQVVALSREEVAVHWGKLLFCAKEAAYKAQFPLTGAMLGFQQGLVDLRRDGTDSRRGSFSVLLTAPGLHIDGVQGQALQGRWAVANGLLATGIVVPGRSTHHSC